MPKAAERLSDIESKVKWAKKHIGDLEGRISRFLETGPYAVGTKIDQDTRRPVYFVKSVEPVPREISLIATDVIQNLRSALDHLAFHLVCSDTGDCPPNPSWIYFPIFKAPVDRSKIQGKIQGAGQVTVDAIERLQPYNGGDNLLWVLDRLNNIGKHRMLLTIGSMSSGFNAGQVLAETAPDKFKKVFRELGFFLTGTDQRPIEPGFELLTGLPGTEPDPNQQFRFTVALHEPGVFECQPVVNALHELAALVDNIIAVLGPCLRDTP